MNDDKVSTKEPFDSARDQRAHDLLYISDSARERIETIHNEAERERNQLKEDQARARSGDIAAEKARLLLQKQSPRPTPSGTMNEREKKRDSNEELELRAARNVDQHNERQVRATYVLEESLTNVVIAEDVRAFKPSRDAQDSPEQRPDHQSVLDTPRAGGPGAAFHRAAQERDSGREQ